MAIKQTYTSMAGGILRDPDAPAKEKTLAAIVLAEARWHPRKTGKA
jgi:hypothetical protein